LARSGHLIFQVSHVTKQFFLDDKAMLAGAQLKLPEEILSSSQFLGIHRSYLVAINKITAMQVNTVEIGKQQIPIGSTYKEELLKRLKLQ
jgi:two-component system, LytTR family, response regulator